ncbi:hypothetical protein L227DRAFT_587758 [Lentinus tigrinus ALCF2SS1-6]|uniref:Methyltransferase domain-containing protein n=1 Tax=Lentinus tigrinus ALCF2SS1-6 TaxID=1328759 RepID=A0A5C2S1B2_9APHY|nr:hypothetical protein L227DRAFT_587758 [Lentinus tigrinus ALCF2SS1-6]
MPHHPFRSEDVPYMQAYTQMSLENDYQSHQLLCRLKPSDSPTFHKFGKKPPTDVLDLGCGEGFWVLHAAKLWKSSNTKVTGLDLIDVHNNHVGEVHPNLEPAQLPKNVTWLRANFVKYALPFPDNSFDLVRMANLTLCIPMNRWKFVLTEVRRVLRPSGRLELIDDDLFFPSILPRTARDSPPSPQKHKWKRTASASSASPSRSSSLTRTLSYKALPELPSPHGSPDPKGSKGHARKPSDVEFSTNATISRHVETIFENMLVNKYGISPHPHQFLEQVLRDVFGSECARQTQQLELAVPSREVTESCEAQGLGLGGVSMNTGSTISHGHSKRSSEDKKRSEWMSIDWDKKEKRSRPSSPVPIAISLPSSSPTSTYSGRSSLDSVRSMDLKLDPQLLSLTPKARQLLFGEGENVHGGKTQSWRATGPYQPPGLVLLPSTLIPFPPLDLEMHTCKHMNTLLACKYALSKYIAGQKCEDGQPLLSEREVDDYLWDYECFRRKRFNWPQDIPGLRMEDEFEEPVVPPAPTKSSIFNKFSPSTPPATEPHRSLSSGGLGAPVYGGVSVSRQSSTHVRTIRVYEAVKVHHHCSCHAHGHCDGS